MRPNINLNDITKMLRKQNPSKLQNLSLENCNNLQNQENYKK